MKYQVFMKTPEIILQGWSMNIRGTERHYRVGNCIITYNNLAQAMRYKLGDKKQMIGSVCFKSDKGEVNESWELTLHQFRELFIAEKMKAESKLGQLL